MRVGIDISGGDFAPLANIRGAILAKKTLQEGVSIVLIGLISVLSTFVFFLFGYHQYLLILNETTNENTK